MRQPRTDIIRLPEYNGCYAGEIDYADCRAFYARWQKDLDYYRYPSEWCDGSKGEMVGGGGPEGCETLLSLGDPKAYQRSRELCREIERIDYSNLERTYGAGVRGASPIVPAILMSRPNNMHAWEEEQGAGPVRLFFNMDAAHYYSPAELMRRGFAVAALGIALSRVRPVELFAWYANNCRHDAKEGIFIVRMGMSPFDTGRIGAMVNPAFFRRLGFVGMRRVWGWDSLRNKTKHVGAPRHPAEHYLNKGPDDIVIPRAQHRHNDPIMSNPVEWVKRKVNETLGFE